MREVLGFLAELGFGFGRGFPVVRVEAGEAEEVVGVGSVGVDGDGALKFPDGRGHVVSVAVGATDEHVEGAAVAGDGSHLVEGGLGAGDVFGLFGLEEADGEGV